MTTPDTPHRTKQEIHGGSPWHRQKHAQGVARARAMAEMLAAGLTPEEVGRRFGTSAKAVGAALKRYEGQI